MDTIDPIVWFGVFEIVALVLSALVIILGIFGIGLGIAAIIDSWPWLKSTYGPPIWPQDRTEFGCAQRPKERRPPWADGYGPREGGT